MSDRTTVQDKVYDNKSSCDLSQVAADCWSKSSAPTETSERSTSKEVHENGSRGGQQKKFIEFPNIYPEQ